MLVRAGSTLPDAAVQAHGEIYRSLRQQATALAYVDSIHILSICCVLALPLLLLARRPRPGAAPAAAH